MAFPVDASLAKSVAIHLACVVLLVWGADFAIKSKPAEISVGNDNSAPIEAVAIDQQQLNDRVKQLQQEREQTKAAEDRRIRELERRAQQAEKARTDEESRIQRLAEEKKRADEAAKKAQQAAAEARRQQEQEAAKAREAEQARIVKEQERKKAEEAARIAEQKRKAEQEALAKAQADRERKQREEQLRAEQEKAMQEQMAQEAAARRAARTQQAATEVQRYTALIRGAIQQNLLVDESMRGRSCVVNIRLASNGFVTNVSVVNGDRTVCEASVRAVNRAGTLPVSADPEVYNQLKDINLTVIPEF
ncbi:cell envelope integrity protein TolA [Chromatiaceae bacterium AAb-1]|nr:cell envelope integrity protein TolA [Chromatiaceae bacterium AAb-1]